MSLLSRRGFVAVALAEIAAFVAARGNVGAQSYQDTIYAMCAEKGCDGATVVNVVNCETAGTWDHGSVGPNGERGLAQIHPSGHYAWAYGADADTQLDLITSEFAAGYGCRWSCYDPCLCGALC